jgi:hypothetical protein
MGQDTTVVSLQLWLHFKVVKARCHARTLKKKKNDARINGCFFTRSNTTLGRKVQEEEDEDLNRF